MNVIACLFVAMTIALLRLIFMGALFLAVVMVLYRVVIGA